MKVCENATYHTWGMFEGSIREASEGRCIGKLHGSR